MCRVELTQYCRCDHTRTTRILGECDAGFSSASMSCVGKYEHIASTQHHHGYCGTCYNRMEQIIRDRYNQLIRDITDEGLAMRWPKHDIAKAQLRYQKTMKDEISALWEMSSLCEG